MVKSKVPVSSLINHIKTSCDVDPWAKEMVEELLKEQKQIIHCKDCKYHASDMCCNHPIEWMNCNSRNHCNPDFYCADGEKITMERKYCGKNWDDMNTVLNIMCDIEDRIELSDEQQEAFDIAIQCVTTVLNRMKEDRPIEWDDKQLGISAWNHRK